MKTVLIIDSDLGFVFWLGKTLDAAGYQTLPARNASDASALLSQPDARPDLLIVNPSLPGIDSLIGRLRRSQEDLKIIAVSAFAEADTETGNKPSAFDETYKQTWLDVVRKVMEDPTPARITKAV